MNSVSGLIAPAFVPGTVWLVGAGPGDPGLLTLHAVHALANADVVLHDALVTPEILALASQARMEPVGKRAGQPGITQLRINQRLIRLARAGHRVLRLKGGDPMLFGRGGEEALALAAASVPFRVVPGITAGIGGAAAAGIPITHRGLAQSVVFVTGHGARNEPDWQALASAADALVLYMALRRFAAIAARLRDGGRAADEPVAFVSSATTPRQRVHLTTLEQAPGIAVMLDRGAPTLIVIGPVVALHAIIAAGQPAAPMTLAPAARRAAV